MALLIWLVGIPLLGEVTGVVPRTAPKLVWMVIMVIPGAPLWALAYFASRKARWESISLPEWTKYPAAIVAVAGVIYVLKLLGMLG